MDHAERHSDDVSLDTGSFRIAAHLEGGAGDLSSLPVSDDDEDLLGTLSPVFVTEPTREERLDEAIGRWRLSLAGLAGGHDFLTDMRGQDHLDLTHGHPQGLARLMASRGPTRLSSIVREADALAHAQKDAHRIREIALAHAEEHGLTTCYLGIGEAMWLSPSGRWNHAPILLRPITLQERGEARDDVDLDVDAAVDINPLLMRTLRDEGVLIDSRALVELTNSQHGFDPQPVLDAFRSLGEALPGFRATHALVVGTLVDASGPLLEDFDVPVEDIARHPLIAALAGDAEAASQVAEGASEAGTSSTDPQAAPIAQPAPVAQPDPDAREIARALGDAPALAVQTPPGSATSATVVALVTEQLAAGKRVLLVSQRASRLHELGRHLEDAGISDLVLSLIPDPQLQRGASRSLVRSLAQASAFAAPVSTDAPAGLAEASDVLSGHVEAMHRVQDRWKVSAHEAINALADLSRRRPAPRTSVRLGAEVAERMMDSPERYRDLLRRAAVSGALAMREEDSPWYGAAITSDTQARRALDLLSQLDSSLIAELEESAAALGAPCHLSHATTLTALLTQVSTLEAMRDLFRRVRPEIFSQDIDQMLAALADAATRTSQGVQMGFGERRRWKKLAREMLQPSAPTDDLPALLTRARDVRAAWTRLVTDAGVRPVVPKRLDDAAERSARAQAITDELSVLLAGTAGGTDLADTDFGALAARCRDLLEGRDVLDVLPERTSLLRELDFEGFGPLVSDLRERGVGEDLVLAELELSWWVSVLEFIARAEPTLAHYDGTKLSQVAERYRRLDEQYLGAGRYRVRQRADDLLVETMKRFPDTSRSAIVELGAAGAVSVKDTAAKYQDIVFRARPLWLASPYMVPQVIPTGEHFDLVVLADASTLPTAAAIPAIARARQCIVLGDPLEYADPEALTREAEVAPELSPFAAASAVSTASAPPTLTGEQEVLAEARSFLLDDVSAIAPVVRLVRDHHPATGGVRRFVGALAASMHEDWTRIVAPPSPDQVDDDAYVYVEDGRGAILPGADYIESTEAELQRVSDLVIYHARHSPERSLAIITLTPAHAERVRERVMGTVSALPDLRDFFLLEDAEFFTVVPAERATSLVRDDIIVSLGFGLTPHDRLLHRFGPLSGPHGRRVLVTALTKARGRTSVVSAVHTRDIDRDRLRSDGARDLFALLAFLESGGDEAVLREHLALDVSEVPDVSQAPEAPEASPAPDSSRALVADLAERLRRMGYLVEEDYGLTDERVELAVAHPELPGRFLVAVATDGPRYRAVPDQRERDRLEAERLEAAGWTVERVWSWALFIDPVGESERVRKTVERAYQEYLDSQADLRGRGGAPRHRLRKPKVPAGHPLSFYGPEDFDAVVAYLVSDGRARLADQLAADVREFLAFDSRSVLLDVSISSAIRRYQDAQQEGSARGH